MKKLFATLSLAILLLPAFAQEVTEELGPEAPQLPAPEVQLPVQHNPLNEIDLSIGLGTGLQVLGIEASLLVSLLGSLLTNDTFIMIPFFIPDLGIGYDRWINDKLAVGASIHADVVSALPIGFIGNFAIMPDVKFRWFDHGNLKMYSKLAAGYSVPLIGSKDNGKLKIDKLDVNTKGNIEDFRSFLTTTVGQFKYFPPVGIQAVPLGIEIGTAARGVNGFVEFGAGTQGYVTFGMKTAF